MQGRDAAQYVGSWSLLRDGGVNSSGHGNMPAMKHAIPELDGLRAIAILAVLVTHFTYQKVLVGGYLGVDLFFVLSGFLITSLLLSEERAGGVALGNFYARRALRILPPLFGAVALALVFDAVAIPAGLPAIFFAAKFVT